eukprot:UN32509
MFDVMDLKNLFKINGHILHLSGHGAKTELVTEDEYGVTRGVKEDQINKLMFRDRVKLVFISMCNSENVAKRFVAMGVDHVVAVNVEEGVRDKVAIKFAGQFYTNFFGGKTIKDSFQLARNFCELKWGEKARVPLVLLPKDNTDHGVTLVDLFRSKGEGGNDSIIKKKEKDSEDDPCKRTHLRLPSPTNYQPPVDVSLMGRQGELIRTLRALGDDTRHTKVVVVHGAPHVGKTSFVHSLAHRILRYRHCYNGILYVRFNKRLKNDKELIDVIWDAIKNVKRHRKEKQAKAEIENMKHNEDGLIEYFQKRKK